MRKFWAMAVFTLAITICATSLATGQGDKDKVNLEGTWKLTKLKFGGKDGTDFIKDKTITMTFGKDNKLTSKENDKVEEGKYKVDATKKPMTIDLSKSGGNKDEAAGIFTVEGDILTIALSISPNKDMPGKRPATFEDEGIVVLTLKKQK